MADIRFKRTLTTLPTEDVKNGDIVFVKEEDGNLRQYNVLKDGVHHLVKGNTLDQDKKLDELKTQPEITEDIINSKIEVLGQVYTKTETYTKNEVNARIVTETKGIITTNQTLPQLNSLEDGYYDSATSGTYANGIVVAEGYTVKQKKVGNVWSKVEVKMPEVPIKNEKGFSVTEAISQDFATKVSIKIDGELATIERTLVAGQVLDASFCEITYEIKTGEAFRYTLRNIANKVSNVRFFVTYKGETSRTEIASKNTGLNGNHDFTATKDISKITIYVPASSVTGSGAFNVSYYLTNSIDNKLLNNSNNITELTTEQSIIKQEVLPISLGIRNLTTSTGVAIGPTNTEILNISIKKGEHFEYNINDPNRCINVLSLYVTYSDSASRLLVENVVISNINSKYTYKAYKDIKAITVYATSGNVINSGSISVSYSKYEGLASETKDLITNRIVFNQNPSLELSNIPNNRIQLKGSARVLENELEDVVLSKINKPTVTSKHLSNVIVSDKSLGENGYYYTYNKRFQDTNVVFNRYINPTLREVDNTNTTVIEAPDGVRVRFTLPYYVNKERDVKIYLNGIRLQRTSEYTIYPTKKCVVFKTAPSVGSKIILDFKTIVDYFKLDLSFNGITFDNSKLYLEGIDTETKENNNANYLSAESRKLGISYEVNDLNKVYADIVNDPLDSTKKSMLFRIVEANVLNTTPQKGRVQMRSQGINSSEFENSVDVLLPTSFKHLENYPERINWLTLQEVWCSTADSLNPNIPQFRITFSIFKDVGVGQKLYFSIQAEDLNYNNGVPEFTKLWEVHNKVVDIPNNKWFTLKSKYVAGNESNGYFNVDMISGGVTTNIFGGNFQTQATRYDLLNTSEALYNSFDILKLYTSKALIDFMKDSGRTLDVYWKNWKYDALCVPKDL